MEGGQIRRGKGGGGKEGQGKRGEGGAREEGGGVSKGGRRPDKEGQGGKYPRPQALHFNFARVGPGSRNFNGTHNSGCLHGDAFFHHDIIPECPWKY